jgi:hypothetical protein
MMVWDLGRRSFKVGDVGMMKLETIPIVDSPIKHEEFTHETNEMNFA